MTKYFSNNHIECEFQPSATYVRIVDNDAPSRLGCIINTECSTAKQQIRILTALDTDPVFMTLPQEKYICILQRKKKDSLSGIGLFTLIDVSGFKVVFQEPLLFSFAPRISSDSNSCCSDVLKWWNALKTLHAVKRNIFMALSHHATGPVVDTVTHFVSQNASELPDDPNVLEELQRALLIDGANTFDEGTYELICRLNHSCSPCCFVSRDGSVRSLRYCAGQQVHEHFEGL